MTKPIATSVTQIGQQEGDNDTNNGNGGVLAVQISLGPFLNGGSDRLHFGIARRGPVNLESKQNAIKHCNDTTGQNDHDLAREEFIDHSCVSSTR
jgi:hypothetical protein